MGKRARVTVSDGRVVEGELYCIDRDGNIVLRGAETCKREGEAARARPQGRATAMAQALPERAAGPTPTPLRLPAVPSVRRRLALRVVVRQSQPLAWHYHGARSARIEAGGVGMRPALCA